MIDPRYQGIGREQVTLLTSPDGGALVRLIAGGVDGHAGPGSTHSPITMAHASLSAGGAAWCCRGDPMFNAPAYVLAGSGGGRGRGPRGRPRVSWPSSGPGTR